MTVSTNVGTKLNPKCQSEEAVHLCGFSEVAI